MGGRVWGGVCGVCGVWSVDREVVEDLEVES